VTEEFKGDGQGKQAGQANGQVPAKEKDDIHVERLFKIKLDILNYLAHYKCPNILLQNGEEIWGTG
jgi:hypothetical protein